MGSLNAAEEELRIPRRMEKIVGNKKASADSVGRVFAQIYSDSIRDMLSEINHKLKRNKALRTDWPMRFASFDGHELFSSRSRCCSKCRMRTITVKDKPVIEYYHSIVVCHLIGFGLALPLDCEPMLPGEGEVIAAKRLFKRVLENYSRFFDAVVVDNLYLEAPFINLCLSHGKDVVAVLKDERSILMQDAQGLLKLIEPVTLKEEKVTAHVWDIEGFGTLEGVMPPVRVLHSEEEERKRKRRAGKWKIETEEHNWWWATTIPKDKLSSRLLWRAGHRRWDIENDLYNDLVNNWYMDHCFKHHPTAIVNLVLTLFIAFVLMQSFYKLNMKQQMRAHFTLISIATQLLIALAVSDFVAPWLKLLPVPDT